MNKIIYMKIGILLAFVFFIFSGCSTSRGGKYTLEELDNLAEIKIYSAENNELIITISDEEQLYQFNHRSFFDQSDIMEHQDEWKKKLEGAKEQYYLVSYKYPVARFGRKDLEKNNIITLFDTNIIKMTVAEESIKGLSVPEEFLTFYYEISGEEMDFYHSLVE